MSFVVRPSHLNTWFLLLAIVAVAVIAHLSYPQAVVAGPRAAAQQPGASSAVVQRSNLEGAVSGTIGIDKTRGDSVSVILVDPNR
jgi:hypothetical protein